MANPFITQANPMMGQTLIDPESAALQRQKQFAAALMQQNQQPQGQMVSGRFVAPSITQQLSSALNPVLGSYMMNQADTKQTQLAEALRQQGERDLQAYGQAVTGRAATPEVVPQGQTMRDDQGQLTMGSQMGTAEVKPNFAQGLSILRSSRDPETRQLGKMLMADMFKTQKVGPEETLVRGNFEGGFTPVAQGAEKFRAPIQVDTGTTIEFRDPKDPTKVLQVVQKAQMPQAGQVVEREDGTFLVDTRTGAAKPVVGPQGQALVGGKPLTETQSNATAFGMRAVEANKILKDIEKSGTTTTGGIRTVVSGTLGAIPLVGENLEAKSNAALNFTASADQQKTDQARRNFVTAILRKESGAAISPSEFANEEKKYFPQIGDSKKTIQQKQDARDLAIKALEVQAGPTGARSIKAQQSLQLAPQDQEALNWANSNPNDPRSAQIKQRLGR